MGDCGVWKLRRGRDGRAVDERRVLDSVFGFEAFRPGQAAVIEALLGGRNVLTVMTDGLRARCIASVSPDFLGIHRNPESIVFLGQFGQTWITHWRGVA